ncbi:MAG TPA: tetratricopeptide repeat protein [Actinocrinis sp.]|nr:tetratricopeptide repeat protein [Actinocrinis sp.]
MSLPDGRRSRALLIGTSTYTDETLGPLEAVKATVEDLCAALTDPEFGVFPAENCAKLLDGNLERLGADLTTAAGGAEELLLVYYSGHGVISSKRHELYLALPNTAFAAPEFGALAYDTLRHYVHDSRAKTKVIILDCCFSGRAVSDTMSTTDDVIFEQIEVDGTYVLASSPPDRVSLILEGEQHTAFTGRLIRLLVQGVPDAPEFLTMGELYRRLYGIMRSEGLPLPQPRGTRNADQLVLAVNRAYPETMAPRLRKQCAEAMEKAESGRDWATATATLKPVYEQQVRLLGDTHEDALRTSQYLGLCTSAGGDPQQGAQLLADLLPRQVLALGRDHPDCLKTRQFLAVALGEAGRRQEALAMLRILLPDRRRALGGDDEHTLRTAHMLARNLLGVGEIEEAKAVLSEVAVARERTLGPEHPHTVRARQDLDMLPDDPEV